MPLTPTRLPVYSAYPYGYAYPGYYGAPFYAPSVVVGFGGGWGGGGAGEGADGMAVGGMAVDGWWWMAWRRLAPLKPTLGKNRSA